MNRKKNTIPRIGATDIHSDWMPIASSFHLPSNTLIHLLQVQLVVGMAAPVIDKLFSQFYF